MTRAVCTVFIVVLVGVVGCGGESGGDALDGGTSDGSTVDGTGDGGSELDAPPGSFLDTCMFDTDCASMRCLEEPNVCTRTCGNRFDCPLASSWQCGPQQLGVRECICPVPLASPGCDQDCDGVDADPTGTWRHAVGSSLTLVHTMAQTTQYAFDLDDDGVLDNALGRNVVPVFTTVMTGSSSPSSILETVNQEAVTVGHLLYLHSFHGDATASDGCASWRVHLASQSDPPDFSGTGQFEVDPSVPSGTQLFGSVTNGVFRGSLGEAPLRLRMGDSFNSYVTFRMRGVQLEATLGAAGCQSGRLGGGIPIDDAREKLNVTLTSQINYEIAQDPQGPRAQQLRATFDGNGDNSVTVAEVGAVVMYGPDVDLVDADGNPGQDGVKDSMSVALAFGCLGATYTAAGE